MIDKEELIIAKQRIDYGVGSNILVNIHECDFNRYSSRIAEWIKDIDLTNLLKHTYVVGDNNLIIVYDIRHVYVEDEKVPIISIHRIMHNQLSLEVLKESMVNTLDRINVEGIKYIIDISIMNKDEYNNHMVYKQTNLYPVVDDNRVVYDKSKFIMVYNIFMVGAIDELEDIQRKLIENYRRSTLTEDMTKEEKRDIRMERFELEQCVGVFMNTISIMLSNIPKE